MKFRKKPVVVEAVQWMKPGDHPKVIPSGSTGICSHCGKPEQEHGLLRIEEWSGWQPICPSDWIVTYPDGEHKRVKPDIFAATYEPVDEAKPTELAPAGMTEAFVGLLNAQDECDLLPPRPGDDQMPSGWKLTGECRVPDKHSKGERFWSLIGEVDYALACSLHDGGFNGRRWIVVPVEAEKPSLLEQMEAICRDNDMFAVVRVLHDVAAAHKGNPDYEFYVTIQTPLSDVTFVPNT